MVDLQPREDFTALCSACVAASMGRGEQAGYCDSETQPGNTPGRPGLDSFLLQLFIGHNVLTPLNPYPLCPTHCADLWRTRGS